MTDQWFSLFVPGRIEVLGKHTDYCGGRSIVCAVEQGFRIQFAANPQLLGVRIERTEGDPTVATAVSETMTLDWRSPAVPAGWWKYPHAVLQRVSENFRSRPLIGVDVRFSSNLPPAAGLSSSSALMIALFLAISKANALETFPEFQENIGNRNDLVEYLGCIENGRSFRKLQGDCGVGTFGGSQDHAAILLGRRGYLSEVAFAPLRLETEFAMPQDLCFAVATSGVAAEKTGAARAAYNRCSLMVEELVQRWPGTEQTLWAILRRVGVDELTVFIRRNAFTFTTSDLIDRVQQFWIESEEIIPAVRDRLVRGEFDQIGSLVDRSQHNSERLLRNQIPETIFLQACARRQGAIASSAFGAGFGGSVYAIVEQSSADAFLQSWRDEYLREFPERCQTATFFTTRPAEAMA
ncbi:MAG: galactokinase [Planctomycetia bacterium]|nr:galactokinase [Planctomycetia bacterium]